MKKLMIALSAALSFSVFAEDGLPSGVNFEQFNEGRFDFRSLDDGTLPVPASACQAFWITNTDNDATIEVANGRYSQADAPDQWSSDDFNSKYLHFEGGLVYRTAKTCITDVGDRRTIEEQADNPDSLVFFDKSQLYFDSMVKFTAYDELQAVPDDQSKLAVYVYAPEDEAKTNLVIAGGYCDGDITSYTNYVTDTVVDLAAWHRLTIRAINASKDLSDKATFVVYLDGQLVTYTGDCGLTADDVNSSAGKFIGGDANALVPSRINNTEICAMGFCGSGDVDDISMTDVRPAFLAEAAACQVEWTEGVATLKIGNDEAFPVAGEGTTNVTFMGDSLTVVATYQPDYARGVWTATGATAPVDGNTFTEVTDGATLSIKAVIPVYSLNGVFYDNATDVALAAQPGDTIKVESDAEDVILALNVEGEVTIDLAGHTLSGYSDMPVIMGEGNTTVIITNSTPEVGKVIPKLEVAEWDEVEAVVATYIVVYGGIFDGPVLSDEDMVVYGGTFLDPGADEQVENFYAVDLVAPDVGVEYVGDNYFQVGGTTPPPPPEDFAVNYESGEGTELTVTTEDGTIVESGESVPAGTKLTITVEAQDGYKSARIFVNEIPFASGETYTVDGDIMITSSADALETWYVTVGSFDETQVESLKATPDEVREDAEDKTVTLEAVFKEGFELDYYTVNGLRIDGDTFVIEADTTVGVVAKSVGGGWDPTVDPTVPASSKGITGKLANASFKDLSTWAQNNSVAFKADNLDEYADAFLLDCDPDDVKEAAKNFKFASIAQDADGNWVVAINNEDLRGGQHFYGNGIAIITRYSDVTCKTPAADGNFFKAALEVYSVATPE